MPRPALVSSDVDSPQKVRIVGISVNDGPVDVPILSYNEQDRTNTTRTRNNLSLLLQSSRYVLTEIKKFGLCLQSFPGYSSSTRMNDNEQNWTFLPMRRYRFHTKKVSFVQCFLRKSNKTLNKQNTSSSQTEGCQTNT